MPGDDVPVGLRHIIGGDPIDDVGECIGGDDKLPTPGEGWVDEGTPMPPGYP